MDDDGHVSQLPAARSNTHKLPSIVGDVHDEAGHHLVACGYLVLDDVRWRWRRQQSIWAIARFYAFAAGLLAGKQLGVVDEVGGQHLVHCVQVPLDLVPP